jgi:hypothetical protein
MILLGDAKARKNTHQALFVELVDFAGDVLE